VTAMALLTRVQAMVHHTMPPTVKINKVKYLALIFFDHCLYPIKTSSSIKNISSKRFFCVICFHSSI